MNFKFYNKTSYLCLKYSLFSFIPKIKKWQVRRESNPQPPDLESGALPIGATDLQKNYKFLYLLLNLCLFMHYMLITEFAVFLKLQFIRSFSLILSCCIVPSLALSTGKSNIYSIHNLLLLRTTR